MGTWGPRIFDNDDASDMALLLRQGRETAPALLHSLDATAGDDYGQNARVALATLVAAVCDPDVRDLLIDPDAELWVLEQEPRTFILGHVSMVLAWIDPLLDGRPGESSWRTPGSYDLWRLDVERVQQSLRRTRERMMTPQAR